MSWNSGAGSQMGGAAYVVTEGEPGAVRIDDDDVRADERGRVMLELGTELMREPDRYAHLDRLLVTLTQTHPGLVYKLQLLWGDVEAEVLPRRTMLDLAKVLRAMAGGLEVQADAPLSP